MSQNLLVRDGGGQKVALQLEGQTFGQLRVIRRSGTNVRGNSTWDCVCECGRTTRVPANALKSGNTTSCGCLNRERSREAQLKRWQGYDLTGQRFGNLTVIEVAEGKTSNGNRKWLCLCDCGGSKRVAGANLRRGHTRSCGCLPRTPSVRKHSIDAGTRFGSLVVIAAAPSLGKSSAVFVKCDCGAERLVRAKSLLSDNTKSCGCAQVLRAQGKPITPTAREHMQRDSGLKRWFVQYKHAAGGRSIDFSLSFEQARELFVRTCRYCGVEPTMNCRGAVANGIDRLDSSKGYTFDNCVPCCRTCNIAKGALTAEAFVSWVRRASAHLSNNPL